MFPFALRMPWVAVTPSAQTILPPLALSILFDKKLQEAPTLRQVIEQLLRITNSSVVVLIERGEGCVASCFMAASPSDERGRS